MEIRSIESFLDYYDKVQARTRRVIDCIPADKLEWTFADGHFTLGDLVRHLAAINRSMFAECVMNRPSRYPGHGRELADGYDATMKYFADRQLASNADSSYITGEVITLLGGETTAA